MNREATLGAARALIATKEPKAAAYTTWLTTRRLDTTAAVKCPSCGALAALHKVKISDETSETAITSCDRCEHIVVHRGR